MNIMAENKKTEEIYECNTLKAIADVRSEYRITAEEAEEKLEKSTIDNPVDLYDCVMWNEVN
jgi:hypothetical protein